MAFDHISEHVLSLGMVADIGKKAFTRGLSVALVTSCLVGAACAAEEWEPMKELDTGIQPEDTNVVTVWKDVMQEEADQVRSSGSREIYVKGQPTKLPDGGFLPGSFLYANLTHAGDHYLVSIMLQRSEACDSGANSLASQVNYSICPVRITKIAKDGSSKTAELPGACMIIPSQFPTPLDRTETVVRINGEQIIVDALNNGAPIPGCQVIYDAG